MINTTGIVVAVENEKAFVHISRSTACENCGACHFDENTLNMKITAINNAKAVVGDRVELSLDNVNYFRASFFLYGIPLIALLVGLFASYYTLEAIGAPMYDLISILVGIGFMAIAFWIIKLNSDKFADNKRYMSIITGVVHQGDFPVVN